MIERNRYQVYRRSNGKLKCIYVAVSQVADDKEAAMRVAYRLKAAIEATNGSMEPCEFVDMRRQYINKELISRNHIADGRMLPLPRGVYYDEGKKSYKIRWTYEYRGAPFCVALSRLGNDKEAARRVAHRLKVAIDAIGGVAMLWQSRALCDLRTQYINEELADAGKSPGHYKARQGKPRGSYKKAQDPRVVNTKKKQSRYKL